eukprot:m.358510 g.358510  ORF g.358510 m.358510 type:complete len:152 (+) comp18163_c0_seq1:1460-1915(+)
MTPSFGTPELVWKLYVVRFGSAVTTPLASGSLTSTVLYSKVEVNPKPSSSCVTRGELTFNVTVAAAEAVWAAIFLCSVQIKKWKGGVRKNERCSSDSQPWMDTAHPIACCDATHALTARLYPHKISVKWRVVAWDESAKHLGSANECMWCN